MGQTHNEVEMPSGTEAENPPESSEKVHDLTAELDKILDGPGAGGTDPALRRTFKRRSSRLTIAIPVIIRGTDTDANVFKENAWTMSVSKHGAKLAVFHSLARGAQISIENPVHGHTAKARVAYVEKKRFAEDPSQVGVETEGDINVWGIRFPPEDWKAGFKVARPAAPEQESAPPDAPLMGPGQPAHVHSVALPETSRTDDNESADSTETRHGTRSEGTESPPGITGTAASGNSDDVAPKRPLDHQELESLRSKLEAAQRGLSALTHAVVRIHSELRTEVDAIKRQTQFVADGSVESKLKDFETRLEDRKSLLPEDILDRVTRHASEAIRPIIAQQKSKWESLFEEQSSRVDGHIEERVRQKLEILEREHFEKARVDLGAAAETACANCNEAAKRCEALGDHVAALTQQSNQDLANRQASVEAALKETMEQSRKDFQGLELAVSDSFRTRAEQTGDEIARRLSESAERALNRFTENSQQIGTTMRDEEMARIQVSFAELTRSSQEGFARFLEDQVTHAKNECEELFRAATDEAVQVAKQRVGRDSEEQIESIAAQMRQLSSDTLVWIAEEAGVAQRASSEELSRGLESLTKPALDSLDQRCKAVRAEFEETMSSLLNSSLNRLREAEAQVGAAGEKASVAAATKVVELEAECQRKLERVFAEASDTRIRQFEDHLTKAGEAYLKTAQTQFQHEVEYTRRDFSGQIQGESERIVQDTARLVRQEAESATTMVHDWLDQASKRLECAAQEAEKQSQQQMNSLIEASIQELHRRTALQIRDFRDHLHHAVEALGNLDQPATSQKPSDAPESPSAPGKGLPLTPGALDRV